VLPDERAEEQFMLLTHQKNSFGLTRETFEKTRKGLAHETAKEYL
jgi:hypothetical protein